MNSGWSKFLIGKAKQLFFWLPLLTSCVLAQTPGGTLRGRVTDPTGAVIPQTTVTATSENGNKATAVSDGQGIYEMKGLAPGKYMVGAKAKGFTQTPVQNVAIAAGQVQQLDLALEIEVEKEKVEVQEENPTVSVNPSENASSLVIKGKDLEALSDDPDELQQELEALAGPSAGPNGGQIYIDGFTAGQLPPKSSIREIRINQNPFSAEYDKLGYGRIEIFTKPGTDQFHGQIMASGNASAFNSGNPFVTDEPPYNSERFDGSIGGPLISKKASFFFDAQRRNINNLAVVNATTLGPAPDYPLTPFTQAVSTPQTRTNLGPRIDYQLSTNNTLTIRYQFFQDNGTNNGIGQFSLPSQGYNSSETEHTVQISDTQVLSSHVVNETRFQYLHDYNSQTVQNFQPTVTVLGAFTDGGNSIGNSRDTENHYEVQNYTSIAHGTHLIKFGGRLRGLTDSNTSYAGFNGVFTFPSLTAYESTLQGQCSLSIPANCPSQFSIVDGQPNSQVSLVDVGLYGQDDWRIRPNMTLSYGLRFETQNDIHDHGDWAPRLTLAWGLGRGNNPSPKTVLRAGFGIFYDRIPSDFVLQAERLNGVTQQQTIVANPTFFPNIPTTPISNSTVSPTIYQLASGLRAPYTMQSAIGVERQVTRRSTVSVTYINSIGNHQVFIRNANAPLPGTYNPDDPSSGVRPCEVSQPNICGNLGNTTNIYQYDSEGIFRQNQLITNFRINAGAMLSLFGFYMLNYSNSDLGTPANSGGGGGFFGGGGSSITANFLRNQYDPMQDYGRSAFDVHHRAVLGGTISGKYGFRLNPFMLIASGAPYNVTVGQDLNGDSIFNDRPALVSPGTCSVVKPASGLVCTPIGTFNPLPGANQALVPVNYGGGPTLFTLNLRLSKTFGLGREVKGATAEGGMGGHGRGGGGPGGGLGGRGLSGGGGNPFGPGTTTNRRYNLTFSVSARNVLNRVNFAAPVGDLNSPQFGQSIALAGGPFSSGSANRRIDLQMLFSF